MNRNATRSPPTSPDPYFLSSGRPEPTRPAGAQQAAASPYKPRQSPNKLKSTSFWRKLTKKRPNAKQTKPNALVPGDPFSSVRLPDMDFRTERLSITPMWLLATQHANAERQEMEEKKRRYLANPPPRPVQRKSTQRSWRSSRGPNMLMGSSSTSHSPQRRRSVKPGLMEGSSQDTPPPSHQPLPEANQAPSTTLSHGRQPSQNGLHQGVPQMYHLPSSRLRTSQVHIRPSPQRKPTLTSVHTPLKEEEEGQEQMAIVGSSASPRTPNYITRPPLRSSSFASASNSSHKDDVSLTSRPSTGQSTSGLRASGDQSQATAATSVSSCSWLSDSDSEEAGQKHITHHPSEDEEEDMIDPAASQLGQLSLQQGRATATHESLLARKFSIERAARTRLARTPSKRVKYHSGKSVPERVLE